MTLANITHPILLRQIKKNLSQEELMSPSMLHFLQSIQNSYSDHERNKKLYEMSIELNDREYSSIMQKLQAELEGKIKLQKLLIESIAKLEGDSILPRRLHEATELQLIDFLNLQIEKSKILQMDLITSKLTAEKANQAKSEFLSMMSHEIRTPLNAIIGLTYIISREGTLDSFNENFSTLKLSANNLNLLINDILDFSKIEAGKIDLDASPFNLKNAIQDVVKSIELQANEHGNKLHLSLPIKMHDWFLGDALRISQIMINLLTNACKFTKNGTVSVSCDVLNDSDHDQEFKFTVADTGIGIALEKQATIFEPFMQADNHTTRKYGGSGLGLVITKRLLNLLGSDIFLQSELGSGSTFSFNLKLSKIAQELTSDKTKNTPSRYENSRADALHGMRILLVEDYPINVAVAKKILQSWQATVTVAENGLIATELYNPLLFDIILMDIQMPVMDGYEATKIIRNRDKNIPIIALTASASMDDNNKVIECGMNDFVGKPFNPNDLLHKLMRYYKS